MNVSWEWFLSSQLIHEILKGKEKIMKTVIDSWAILKFYEINVELKGEGFN